MLAFTGYTTDPETGERLPPIGTLLDVRGLDALVEGGILEQTNWSGYPLTYVGRRRQSRSGSSSSRRISSEFAALERSVLRSIHRGSV